MLVALVGVVLVFGLRANGSVADDLSTIDRSAWLVDPPLGTVVRSTPWPATSPPRSRWRSPPAAQRRPGR
ncbi:MAG: hypothetical protein R2755_23270 [Acidimicrobiales bacterium]